MKFTKKIVLAIMTGVILTTSAIPGFAQQASTSNVASEIPERGTRATNTVTVSPKIYWHSRANSSAYEVGTVNVQVTYGYNSITKTGTVKSVKVINYNINEDFKGYQSGITSKRVIITVSNLEPGSGKYQKDSGKNLIDFFVKSDGSVSYTNAVSILK